MFENIDQNQKNFNPDEEKGKPPLSFVEDDYEEGNNGWEEIDEKREYDVLDRYTPFDAQSKLKEIRKLAKLQKQESLQKFKRNLNWQRFVITNLYDQIAQRLTSNPGTPKEELFETIKSAAVDGRMTREQIERAEYAIDAYYDRRSRINEVREKYSDEEIFELITGSEPQGDIEIITEPVHLFVRCFDVDDYARVFHQDKNIEEIDEEARQRASKSGGIRLAGGPEGLAGAVTAERVTEEGPPKSTFNHEREHAIQTLLKKDIYPEGRFIYSLSLAGVSNAEQVRSIAKKEIKKWIEEEYQELMKDEILAFLKGSKIYSSEEIAEAYEYLITPQEIGGIYQPSQENKEDLKNRLLNTIDGDREFLDHAEKILTEEIAGAIDELNSQIYEGIVAFVELREYGYSDRKISLMFMNEKLSRWPKVAERMTG